MVYLSTAAALAAPLASILHVTLVAASPFGDSESVGSFQNGIFKREGEDDTDADILADGTGPLRSGK